MITNKQFSSISFASGTASTFHAFGIGGNTKAGLVLEAKRNLYLNYSLKPSQVIGQTTVDFKRTLFFPLSFTKATVSAEIIDFSETEIDSAAVQESRRKFTISFEEDVPMKAAPFAVGEDVIYVDNNNNAIPAKVLTRDGRRYIIQYTARNKTHRLKRVPLEQLQSRTKMTGVYDGEPNELVTPKNTTGELVKFKHKDKTYTGEFIEISETGLLLRMQKANGQFVGFYVSPDDIVE